MAFSGQERLSKGGRAGRGCRGWNHL